MGIVGRSKTLIDVVGRLVTIRELRSIRHLILYIYQYVAVFVVVVVVVDVSYALSSTAYTYEFASRSIPLGSHRHHHLHLCCIAKGRAILGKAMQLSARTKSIGVRGALIAAKTRALPSFPKGKVKDYVGLARPLVLVCVAWAVG